MADFAQWGDPVVADGDDFAAAAIGHLEEDVAAGGRGLKVTKELGLYVPGPRRVDVRRLTTARLAPIWQRAGELGVPVLIHVSDPVGFFLPIDERNEHYLTLQEFPGWSFAGSHFSQGGVARAAKPDDRRRTRGRRSSCPTWPIIPRIWRRWGNCSRPSRT